MLDLSRLDLDEIAEALSDQADYEHQWLLNPTTREVMFCTSDTGIDGETRVDLVWYAFRDTRARCRAVEWLADNSLIDDGATTR